MNERTRLKQKQYRIDHKEELAAKKKIYYLENKERIYEYARMRWATVDLEEKKEQDRLYYLANKDRINERLRDRRVRARMQPERLHRDMLKEFKSKYSPWFEGHVKGVYQIDFD
jgi:hypothetical protein